MDGPFQVQPLRVKMELAVMATKSTSKLEPHHLVLLLAKLLSVNRGISQCILSPVHRGNIPESIVLSK